MPNRPQLRLASLERRYPLQDNRIPYVEDDEDTRNMLNAKPGLSDFDTAGPPDMDAALRLMGRKGFSLYVLDGGLRDIKGPSLCEQIRAPDARTPIPIFSGHAFASDIEPDMLAGANA